MPKVSVIIPTYNRPELLSRALLSVLVQTFQDFEIIVVDDGDKESAESMVLGFSDNRIYYIKNNPSKQGGGATRNRGIKEARGEFTAFLDDDDEWIPQKLNVQMAQFASVGSDVAFCFSALTNVYPDHEEPTVVEDGIRDFSEIALARFNGFLTSTLVIRKSALDEVGGFDETLPSHQEPELIIRITRRYKGVGINEPLVRMNMTPREHIGGSVARRIQGREMLIAKHVALYKERPKLLAKHYFQIGLWYRDVTEYAKARIYFLKSFSISGNIRYLAHGIVAVFHLPSLRK
jgi:glycosyltransferase involved in cell wall biosynthesis